MLPFSIPPGICSGHTLCSNKAIKLQFHSCADGYLYNTIRHFPGKSAPLGLRVLSDTLLPALVADLAIFRTHSCLFPDNRCVVTCRECYSRYVLILLYLITYPMMNFWVVRTLLPETLFHRGDESIYINLFPKNFTSLLNQKYARTEKISCNSTHGWRYLMKSEMKIFFSNEDPYRLSTFK